MVLNLGRVKGVACPEKGPGATRAFLASGKWEFSLGGMGKVGGGVFRRPEKRLWVEIPEHAKVSCGCLRVVR